MSERESEVWADKPARRAERLTALTCHVTSSTKNDQAVTAVQLYRTSTC